jgi:AcrR family transcriptional regulator
LSPRRYHPVRRKAATEATRQRIVDSTVALHAERGVLGTTYAMIANRADVAVPTVYNHFPALGNLLQACTGQAAAGAPPLGPEIFTDGDDVGTRLRCLVDALFAQYAYYAPWLRWAVHEAHAVPELGAWLAEGATGRRQLLVLALAPSLGRNPPAALITLCESLTDFATWQRFEAGPKAARRQARHPLARALAALAREFSPDRASARAGSPRPPTGGSS